MAGRWQRRWEERRVARLSTGSSAEVLVRNQVDAARRLGGESAVTALEQIAARLAEDPRPQIRPMTVDALVALGRALLAVNRPEEVLEVLEPVASERAAAGHPRAGQIALALVVKSRALFLVDQAQEAMSTLDEALAGFDDLAPADGARVVHSLGHAVDAAMGQGRNGPALEICDRVLNRCGRDTDAILELPMYEMLFRKGNVLSRSGRAQEAFDVWQQVLVGCGRAPGPRLRSVSAMALANQAGALAELGRRDEAVQYCDQVLSRHGADPAAGMRQPIANALFKKGWLLQKAGRGDEALQLWQQVVDRFDRPGYGPTVGAQVAAAVLGQSDELGLRGRWAEALALADQVLQQHADGPAYIFRRVLAAALANRAEALVGLDRPEEALEACAAFHSRYEQPPEEGLAGPRAGVLLAEGAASEQLGRPDEAATAYEAVLHGWAHDPEQGEKVARAGAALERLGRHRPRNTDEGSGERA